MVGLHASFCSLARCMHPFLKRRIQEINATGHGVQPAALHKSPAHRGNHLLRRKALLLGGDTAALLAFAAIGRSNHGESLDLGSVLSVAWPFLAGTLTAASDKA